ncbi:hypothetical protein [Rhizobium sp. BK251]|uniref:hypothetical protein n=1 Tax=Rhizobium sp. BK251 TaxID=2512125 RepID=UPI001048DF0B|nr:hypothetical protein [Rhizobium sp. BK251]TCL71936.1 hypothetical protein EV286_105194 [Rhizobium sp. BK251]
MSISTDSEHHDLDVLAGALYSWCAERNIKLHSQQGLSAASAAIDLYDEGHRTQDALLSALHSRELH